jgi:hypothetical protein
MPVRKSKNVAINKRREQVADLYLQGKTQMEISEVVGVGQPTVSSDLKRIQAQWRESSVRDFDLARELELRKIDRIEREAWAAWERSKKPSQSATTSDDPNQRRTRRQVKNQNGDPRFLEQVNKCIASRRALLGLDAPIRTEIETDGFSMVERHDRIVTVLTAIRDRQGTQVLGAGLGDLESRLLCADREPGTLEAGPPPQLP